MKNSLLISTVSIFLGCFASAQPLLSVGAKPQFGTLDGVDYESCAVSPFLSDQRIYLCYRKRVDGDLVVGERVLGADMPVNETYPERVISRVVLALENHFDDSKTLYYEFPKEAYRDLTYPNLGPIYSSGRTHLAIVLQAGNLTVYMSGSDGAGSYRVNWIISAKDFKVRRLDSVGEGDEVDRKGPWLDLKKIPEPHVAVKKSK
jgi:hypothetical protein